MQPINRGLLNGPDSYIKCTPGKAFNVTFGGLGSRIESCGDQLKKRSFIRGLGVFMQNGQEQEIKTPGIDFSWVNVELIRSRFF